MSQRPLQRFVIGLAGAVALSSAALAGEPGVSGDPAPGPAVADLRPSPPPQVYIPQALAAAKSSPHSNVMDVPLSQTLRAMTDGARLDPNGLSLGEPISGPAHIPTPQELRDQRARDRANALRTASILSGMALALGLGCVPLYLTEPRLGARRLGVVTAMATSLATASAFTMQITTWTPEFGLAVAASSLALGAGLLFLALLGLAGWRWVSAGFCIDRAGRNPTTPIT